MPINIIYGSPWPRTRSRILHSQSHSQLKLFSEKEKISSYDENADDYILMIADEMYGIQDLLGRLAVLWFPSISRKKKAFGHNIYIHVDIEDLS